MPDRRDSAKANAKVFARRVIEQVFGQTIDDEKLDRVAEEILKTSPALWKPIV